MDVSLTSEQYYIWLGGLVTIVLSVFGKLILLWLDGLLVGIPPEFEPTENSAELAFES